MQQCFQQWFQQTTTTILNHHFNLYFLMIEEKLCKKNVSHPSVWASYGLAGLHSWPGTHRDNSNHIAFHEMIIRQPLSSKKWTLLRTCFCVLYLLIGAVLCFAVADATMLHNGPSTQNTLKSQCIKSNISRCYLPKLL